MLYRVELEHVRILEKLLELEAMVNVRDSAGYTPLAHCLTSAGNETTFKMARMLLEKGADPNLKNRMGWIPLFDCVIHQNRPYIKLLMKFGSDPHSKSNKGNSCQDAAMMYPDVAPLLKKGEKSKLKKEREQFKKCALCKKDATSRCTGRPFHLDCLLMV